MGAGGEGACRFNSLQSCVGLGCSPFCVLPLDKQMPRVQKSVQQHAGTHGTRPGALSHPMPRTLQRRPARAAAEREPSRVTTDTQRTTALPSRCRPHQAQGPKHTAASRPRPLEGRTPGL